MIKLFTTLLLFVFLIGGLFAQPEGLLTPSSESSGISLDQISDPFSQKEIPSPPPQSDYVSDFALDESEYIIGPGDVFDIYIEKKNYKKAVNPEGKIILEKIGVISINNLTLKEAKATITTQIKKSNTIARTYVNLATPKKIRVFVTGAVNNPGIYEVPANHRLTDVLKKASWFGAKARKSLITVTPKLGEKKEYQLKKFLIEGDLSENPYIQQGSIIHVPFIDYEENVVTVRYKELLIDIQIENSETIHDMILKFNSYQNESPMGKIIVHEKGKSPKVITAKEASTLTPAPNSLIEISSGKFEVYVGGAVQSPGFLKYNPDYTISQYIAQAGLMPTSKISKQVTVIKSKGDFMKDVALSNKLEPGDAIIVKENLERKFTIWAPILLSAASMTIIIITLTR